MVDGCPAELHVVYGTIEQSGTSAGEQLVPVSRVEGLLESGGVVLNEGVLVVLDVIVVPFRGGHDGETVALADVEGDAVPHGEGQSGLPRGFQVGVLAASPGLAIRFPVFSQANACGDVGVRVGPLGELGCGVLSVPVPAKEPRG